MKRKQLLLSLITISLVTNVWAASRPGKIITNPKYTAVVSNKNEELKGTVIDKSTETTPINSLVVAAHDGTNEVTVKGNGTVSDTIANQTDVAASKWKHFDGTEVKAPAYWTIVKDKPIGYVSANRYRLQSRAENAGLLLADESYKGHNDITLENVSIKTISSNHSIFANQQLSSIDRGISDTTITFKGTNYLFTDGSKSPKNAEINGIEMLKNDPNKYTGKQYSHTYIKSEPGSILNIYTTTGTSKGRGIGITQYRDMSITNTGTKTTTINQTEMDFHGAVNIKVDRGDNKDAENYGVYVGNLPRKNNDSDEPSPESYNRVTFYSDVKVDVQPVLDKDGKQISIGDAFNVDGPGSKVDVKGDGKVQIDGDIHVLNGGKLELNLKNKDSYFHGEAHMGKQQYGGDPDDSNNPSNGQLLFDEDRDLTKEADHVETKFNFTMTNGSRWEATNTSKINNFNISNGATVNFGNPKRNINISVENLKGTGGTFNMHGKIADFTDKNKGQGIADKLIVRKSSEGDHKIIYKDDGTAPTKGHEYAKLVEYVTENKDDIKGHFKLINGTTDQGAYEFTLTRPDDSKLVKIEGKDETEVVHDDFYLNPTGRLSSGGQAVDVLHNMIYQANVTTMGTLVQRLGEIHFEKELKTSNDFWIKHIEGKFYADPTFKRGAYQHRYYGLQGGYDWKRTKGRWNSYHGIELGMLHSYGSLDGVTGSLKLVQREIGLYSTWLNRENNTYVDLVGRVATYRGGFDMFNNNNTDISSNTMQTTSYLLSAEMGRRFYRKETERRKYFIQPEAQLSYHFTGGYPLYMKHGLTSVTDDFRSLVLRLGFRAGVDHIKTERANPYIKFMYEQELLGDMKHTFNGVAVETPTKRDRWFTYGFGFTYLSKDKTEQFYLESQRSTRHKVKQSWQVNLGLRHTF